MRILIFNWRDIDHPHAGGAEVYTHEVAKAWVDSGHHVTLFSSGHPKLTATANRDGVDIIRRGSRYSVYWHATRFYKRHGRGEFDLIVDQSNTRPFHVHRYADCNTPIITLVHQLAREIWFHEFPRPLALFGRHLLEPYWLWKCRGAKVVAVSESTAQSLRAHKVWDIEIVPEGMSLPPYAVSRRKESVPTLLFCGRLSTNKRPDDAMRAFAGVRRSIPDARMWVIGTGPMEAELRKLAPEGVSFLGRVGDEEKFEYMARAHALVSTSVREGWGLVVSEAAAVGTPTIGYDVPGLRDSIPASGGVVTTPTVDALSRAIEDNLVAWKQNPPLVESGGVLPWREVATRILRVAGFVDLVGDDEIDIRDDTRRDVVVAADT